MSLLINIFVSSTVIKMYFVFTAPKRVGEDEQLTQIFSVE